LRQKLLRCPNKAEKGAFAELHMPERKMLWKYTANKRVQHMATMATKYYVVCFFLLRKSNAKKQRYCASLFPHKQP